MRLAVLSDIHGNLTALESAWADVQAQGEFDQIWVLGDLAAFGPRPAECIQQVRELQEQMGKEKFKLIGGNTDRYLVNGTRPRTPSACSRWRTKVVLPAPRSPCSAMKLSASSGCPAIARAMRPAKASVSSSVSQWRVSTIGR